jgi:hypothetical protein
VRPIWRNVRHVFTGKRLSEPTRANYSYPVVNIISVGAQSLLCNLKLPRA